MERYILVSFFCALDVWEMIWAFFDGWKLAIGPTASVEFRKQLPNWFVPRDNRRPAFQNGIAHCGSSTNLFQIKKTAPYLSLSFSICRQSELYPIYRQSLHVDCRCPWQSTRKFRDRTGLCQPGERWDVNRLPHHTPVARYFEQTTRQERTSTCWLEESRKKTDERQQSIFSSS